MLRSQFLPTRGSEPELLSILFIENFTIALIALGAGYAILKSSGEPLKKISSNQWRQFLLTVLLNTLVTYSGFSLWANGFIKISVDINWGIAVHFVVLFIAMDLLLYALHYLMHSGFLFKNLHYKHHTGQKLRPIDFFIIHPLEAIVYGALWLAFLALFTFNLYAIIFYLVVHVLFGVMSHLGIERPTTKGFISEYLVDSHYHQVHHKNPQHNLGFYTNIWDKLFGTNAGPDTEKVIPFSSLNTEKQ